ncbi:hypothetical protein FA15DRAFT_656034 [Coprinopsis marcescibilis]|uniref:Uncharacterized protein n=1 Tax=Coprinopsis marcescibilis TaxID=230819 RepID=A0A5C3KVN6_COPMA|nr:hypothetical protein FA15DRAFT_656034 [Coprinopsis marcescibilis]
MCYNISGYGILPQISTVGVGRLATLGLGNSGQARYRVEQPRGSVGSKVGCVFESLGAYIPHPVRLCHIESNLIGQVSLLHRAFWNVSSASWWVKASSQTHAFAYFLESFGAVTNPNPTKGESSRPISVPAMGYHGVQMGMGYGVSVRLWDMGQFSPPTNSVEAETYESSAAMGFASALGRTSRHTYPKPYSQATQIAKFNERFPISKVHTFLHSPVCHAAKGNWQQRPEYSSGGYFSASQYYDRLKPQRSALSVPVPVGDGVHTLIYSKEMDRLRVPDRS